MDLQTYIDSKQGKRPTAEIVERWENRMVAQGLEKMGETGARQYLNLYGKSIAAPKCILLATQAQICGFQEVALGFWKKAYELETGGSTIGQSGTSTVSASQILHAPVSFKDDNFPSNVQPGKLATMQPADAVRDRYFYVNNPDYWGQPKRDGNKVVVFATANKVYYQSRSLKLRATPNFDLDLAFIKAAKLRGPFVLEGELYFLDYAGKEHRTGAQAAGVNVEAGYGHTPVLTRYGIFYTIYHDSDLRNQSYAIRVLYGESLASTLEDISPMIVRIPTARTFEEKTALVDKQKAEGREGEVWFLASMIYHAGKNTDDAIIRTKYLIEMNALITGLTPTTAQGRLFGAIEVSDLTGKPIGSIGTGFDRADMQKIWDRFHQSTRVTIPIVSQGYTENGRVMHGRLSEEFE